MLESLSQGFSSRTRISVDVFDTLLLRKPFSERRRFFRIATLFSDRLPDRHLPPRTVYEARVETQRWAYRALDVAEQDGEIKISDILSRQLRLLGLPQELAALLLEIELQVEQEVLLPNRPLICWLQFHQSRGVPVIAISDTSLSAASLSSLIEAVAGPKAVDRVYTSADLGLTKRRGGIFREVANREKADPGDFIHLGDDRRADLEQGRAAGVRATHVPRPRLFIFRRKLDGLWFELGQRPGPPGAPRGQVAAPPESRENFGRAVLGPIVARYCLRLWLYLSSVDQTGGPGSALFCARGGLNLRVVFEEFLTRLQLPLAVPRADFMVSRLIAVRGALLLNLPSAFEEIGREFGAATSATVARALAQSPLPLGPDWEAAYAPETFARLMNTTGEGAKFKERLAEQNALFAAHLQDLTPGKNRLVLCDTGLYGSTLRLLQDGFPEKQWECVLFARCNYKGFASSHFEKTTGLIVERDFYDPLHAPSTVLRYWQFIESLFEPELESVRTFSRSADGVILSNLEVADWRKRLAASRSPLLAGVLSYLADLPGEGWFERLSRDEAASWRALKRAVLFSSRSDLQILSIGERSHDFGRDGKFEAVSTEHASDWKGKLKLFRTSRWKEGLAAQEFPASRWWIQAALEAGYTMRWLLRRMKPSSLRALF